jgi:hypothetical protein
LNRKAGIKKAGLSRLLACWKNYFFIPSAGAAGAAGAASGAAGAPASGAAGAAGAASGAGAGAGAAASGAGAGAAASSFLPQAVMEMASRAASRTEYFIYFPLTK